MKKFKFLMVTTIIATFAAFSVFSSAALVAPTDFKTLDNFNSYATTQAVKNAGYILYPYGNAATTIERTTTGTQSGAALKVTNGGAAERLDFQKTFNYEAGATGISFWINNTSGVDLSISPLVSYNAVDVAKKYFVKAEGTSTYVETDPSTNIYFPLVVVAGFKGEICIPFASYMTTYPMGNETPETRVLVMSVWGVATLYNVVFDNIKYFGVTNPDPEVSEPSSSMATSEVASDTTSMSDDTTPQTSDNSSKVLFPILLIAATTSVLAINRKRKGTVK